MALMFDPFYDMDKWWREEFEPLPGGRIRAPEAPRAPPNPRVDWLETPDSHVLKFDLPGMRKEDVKVEIQEGRTLFINGERKRDEAGEHDRWRRMERDMNPFIRRLRLPKNAKVDEVKAKVENGVLSIVVPKEPEPDRGRDVRPVEIADWS